MVSKILRIAVQWIYFLENLTGASTGDGNRVKLGVTQFSAYSPHRTVDTRKMLSFAISIHVTRVCCPHSPPDRIKLSGDIGSADGKYQPMGFENRRHVSVRFCSGFESQIHRN